MKITPVHLDFDILAGDDRPRGKGVHASDLYNSLFHRMQPQRYTNEDMCRPLVAMGLGWEWQVERALRACGIPWQRPPEYCTTEGIYFNPDGLTQVEGVDAVGEIKLTRMSARAMLGDPRFDKWMTQVKCYCHHLEIPRAVFISGHMNGSYPRKGEDRSLGDPSLKVNMVEFSAAELQEEWDMLLAHGRREGLIS